MLILFIILVINTSLTLI